MQASHLENIPQCSWSRRYHSSCGLQHISLSVEEADTTHNCHEASIQPLLALPAKQHSHHESSQPTWSGLVRSLQDRTGAPSHCEDNKEALQDYLWRMKTQCAYSLCHQWHIYSTTTLLTILLRHQGCEGPLLIWLCTAGALFDPLQPGPNYFLTPRKCTVFGVACEALPCQINFLTDEAEDCGKGANVMISWLGYFFSHHGFGERDVFLHADNYTWPKQK